MKSLINDWKEKYFQKQDEKTSGKPAQTKKIMQSNVKMQMTGVAIRDSMRKKFHEILLQEAKLLEEEVDQNEGEIVRLATELEVAMMKEFPGD